MWLTCSLLLLPILGLSLSSHLLIEGAGGDSGAAAPHFVSRGTTYRAVLGDALVLPCEVRNLGSFVIVWRKGAALLSAGPQMISRDVRLSLIGHSLQIRDITHADQGDYTCQLGDGASGDLIHTIEILKHATSGVPPSIQLVPPNGQATTRRGGPISFECRASGNPPPLVHWSRKDGVLPSGMQTQPGTLLTLSDVQRQHAGVYQCTASNGIGQPVSSEVQLHVLYPPEVSALRSWVTTGEGLEARLDCVVHADPPAEVAWYQDSFLLQPTDRRAMSQVGATHSLTVRHIQLADFGNYSCVVANSIGREKKFIELSGKPGAPVVVSSPHSPPTLYNLTWRVQSVFPISEVRVLYRLVQANATYHLPGQWHDLLVRPHQRFNPATSERTQSFRLTHLQPDATYECLVQAKNQHGFGELSDLHQWFTSLRERHPPAAAAAPSSQLLAPLLLSLFCVRVCNKCFTN